MRILQVGKFYFPVRGGIETVLRNLSEGLVSSGDDVTVLCSGRSRADERIRGVRVIRSPSLGTLFSQPLSPQLPLELRRLARDADIVHLHGPNPLSEAAALMLPASAKVVLSYHSDVVRQRLLLPLYQPMLRAFLKRASKIIVATRNHIEHSSILGDFREKCAVIPYGIAPEDFKLTAQTDALARQLLREHGRFALFVGRLVSYKGLPTLIDAMKTVAARLLIIGEGPMREELANQARAAGIGDRVIFLGNLGDAETLAAFHACEFLVLPSISKNEAFGIVQLEAMACAKPSITTKLDSGITEVNEDGVTGIQVPPEDPRALASAIHGLLEDDERRQAMGQAALARLERHFTRERMVKAYRELYSREVGP